MDQVVRAVDYSGERVKDRTDSQFNSFVPHDDIAWESERLHIDNMNVPPFCSDVKPFTLEGKMAKSDPAKTKEQTRTHISDLYSMFLSPNDSLHSEHPEVMAAFWFKKAYGLNVNKNFFIVNSHYVPQQTATTLQSCINQMIS